jgi:trimethylamine:corrinoid methyltransferase-like protein
VGSSGEDALPHLRINSLESVVVRAHRRFPLGLRRRCNGRRSRARAQETQGGVEAHRTAALGCRQGADLLVRAARESDACSENT